MIEKVVGVLNRQIRVGSTGCACSMSCPVGVIIPDCFRQYNDYHMQGTSSVMTRIFRYRNALSGFSGVYYLGPGKSGKNRFIEQFYNSPNIGEVKQEGYQEFVRLREIEEASIP